jgi:lipopolysaccharide/colanic/teichoic acid biosynthesis glycosyltransferase
LLLTAILVKLSSPGPILHRQLRVGRDGAKFTLYKFRSMYVDAETDTGAVWATRNDPRVTLVGRWLRLFRLDEIPQLVNVLRGEMAIVGPRPERPEFVETLVRDIPFYRQRLCLKPGITGWAQINHKYGDSVEDSLTKLEYDLYYVKNLGPAIDAYIIFHTIKVILLGRGAQ